MLDFLLVFDGILENDGAGGDVVRCTGWPDDAGSTPHAPEPQVPESKEGAEPQPAVRLPTLTALVSTLATYLVAEDVDPAQRK